jgi:predicted GH43/DUF377 family glycosyl hydrolase
MIDIKKEGILLAKTENNFENEGVLNPAAIRVGDFVHLFYRAVSEGNNSSIGYCKLNGPVEIVQRDAAPILSPEFDYEIHGIEDPRIVCIEDLYYLSYTAYDGVNALGALAVSKDLIHWEKMGIMVPQINFEEFAIRTGANEAIQKKYTRYNEHNRSIEKRENQELIWDKNLIFFPRRVNGLLTFLHRIKPDIQIVIGIQNIADLTKEFWSNYLVDLDKHTVLSPRYEHEMCYVGGGCPPIETAEGWLLIYHGVSDSSTGYVYSACAALLDLEQPEKEIARLPYPLFTPELKWELKGEVNNVVFPTGTAIFGETLYIYYGAADEQIAYASVNLKALINELISTK